MSYRIGVDISGGDFAPQETFKGALLAKEECKEDIVFIGRRQEIISQASLSGIDESEIEIVDAPEKVSMEEGAARAIRKKRNSSIVIGCRLLKEKKIDAFVSCGNTGAVVSAGTLFLGLIEGVERPGISIFVPTASGVSLMIDVGANINPKPSHLLQYGIMASQYYALAFKKDNPTVGLLNIGEEETKGSEFMKTVHKLFSLSPLNFIGNIEAKDIFSGKCDCIVCDGLVGNVALKVSEGLVGLIGKLLRDAVMSNIWGRVGYLFIKHNLERFKKVVDYKEYGGAPLFGVDGVVIIGHGRSDSVAVKNAVKVAIKELERDFMGKVKENIRRFGSIEVNKETLEVERRG